MNPKYISAPLVVIAVVSEKNRESVISAMKSIGKQWREGEKVGQREIAFAWMDGERWSKWLKSMYGVADAGATETPRVIVADHTVRVLCILSCVVTTPDTYAGPPRILSTTTSSHTGPRSNQHIQALRPLLRAS